MGVRLGQIVAIVRRDQRNARLARQTDEIAVDARLDFHALVLHFEEEIALAENIAQAIGVHARLIVFLGKQRIGHFSPQARGKRDQALAVACEQLVIHARLVVEAVKVSRRDELDQVAVAFVVLAQKHEMVRAFRLRAAVLVIIRRDIYFAADDRLDAMRRGLVIKIRRGKKIAVVRHGDGRHSAPRGFRRQFADFTCAIEERVIRVEMKVNEI